ncbi:hypothetical protein [Amedibacillus sp. YH-ame10]
MKNEYIIQNFKLLLVMFSIAICIYILIENMELILFILVSILLMGIANGIFWFYIFTKSRLNRILLIIIATFIWPILSMIGTLTLMPILLFEVIYIIMSTIQKCIVFLKEGRNNVMTPEVNIYIKKKRCLSLLLIIMFVVAILIVNLLVIPFIIKIFICIFLFLICYISKIVLDLNLISIFDPILCDRCDSKQYYEISKDLNAKYPKNYAILKTYAIGLRFYESGLEEKITLLNKYQQYNSHLFYMSLQIEVVPESDKKQYFYKFYEKSRQFNERKFKKHKGLSWDYNIKILDMKKMIFEEEYKKALSIGETISKNTTKFNEIRLEFLRGVCFYHLNEMDEAINRFNYIISEGNTLKMVEDARIYLNKIQ